MPAADESEAGIVERADTYERKKFYFQLCIQQKSSKIPLVIAIHQAADMKVLPSTAGGSA